MKKAAEVFARICDDISWEVHEMLKTITWDDLEPSEIVALATALQPAWERRQAKTDNPPVTLELVRSKQRKKG